MCVFPVEILKACLFLDVWHPMSLVHRLWQDYSVRVGVWMSPVESWGFSVLAGDWLMVVSSSAGHFRVGWLIVYFVRRCSDNLLASWFVSR